ncbi:MAG TPA: Flp pilus assembly protein CpaB [Firmicutes bacterium]|nr:Flp pilus assembly protein CpaB [Bacillota bacterium]
MAWSVYRYVSELSRVEAVVVAEKPIAMLSVIQPSDIKMKYVHPSAIVPGAARTKEEAVGMASLRHIYPGEQVLKVALSGGSGGLSFTIERGLRALMIPMALGRCGGGTLRPGDLVDLIFVSDRAKTGESVAKIVARRIPVLDIRDEKGMAYSPGKEEVPLGILVEVPETLSSVIPWCLENGNVYAVVAPFEQESGVAGEDVSAKEVLR